MHVAQLNVARPLEPLGSARLAGFVAALEEVNRAADEAPGFVWRLQGEGGDATDLRPWGEEIIVNLSVWESVEALRAYVFGAMHAAVLRRRREWFEVMTSPHVVLWWVEPGHRPDLDEAGGRLRLLADNGPTERAFTLRTTFAASM